jgi:hypothetical protein
MGRDPGPFASGSEPHAVRCALAARPEPVLGRVEEARPSGRPLAG